MSSANCRPDDRADYETVLQADLPSGRKGKHHSMLVRVVQNLDRLPDGRAIRIPLKDCEGSVADIRAAIFRATNKRAVEIATSSDDEFFYVWKPTKNGRTPTQVSAHPEPAP